MPIRTLLPIATALLLAFVAASSALAFTPEKTSRIDRLINANSDSSPPVAHGPKVSDPTVKALDQQPAYKAPMPKGPIVDPDYSVAKESDRLVLEPDAPVPLNGEIKLD